MYDYLRDELPALIRSEFSVGERCRQRPLDGRPRRAHYGAQNPGRYASVSAFAPIVQSLPGPVGQKAFTAYLGADESAWHSGTAAR